MGCGDLAAMGEDSRAWLTTMEAPGYTRHPHSFWYFAVNSFRSTINILQCFLHFCTFQRLSAVSVQSTTCIGFFSILLQLLQFFHGALGLNFLRHLQRLECLQSVWVGHLWHSQLFVAFMRRSGWLLCGTWSVCSIYGALGLDPCGVYSVNSVYWALGLDICGVLQRLQRLWGFGAVCLALGSCLAFACFYMLSVGGCLQAWCIGAQASPSYEPLLSELGIQLGGPFALVWGLMAGGHWFASHGCVTLSRAWLCQKWKPLELLISYKQP